MRRKLNYPKQITFRCDQDTKDDETIIIEHQKGTDDEGLLTDEYRKAIKEVNARFIKEIEKKSAS
jgi:hypothetical protein